MGFAALNPSYALTHPRHSGARCKREPGIQTHTLNPPLDSGALADASAPE